MDAAIAALLGALIGGTASVVTIVIQQKYQGKRELLKIATELALEDYKRRYQLIEELGGKMPPMSAFVYYHAQVLEHMAAGTYSPETIKVLSEKHDAILNAYIDAAKGRKEAKRAT